MTQSERERNEAMWREFPDAPAPEPRYSNELHEAVGQLTDLWRGVREFRFARPHRYPAGTEAVWVFLRAENAGVPEEWLGFPVVAVIGGDPS